MQFTASLLAFAALALASVGTVAADEQLPAKAAPHPEHATTIWKPTATNVVTRTFTGSRVEQHWTTVSPYMYTTTVPITWTQTQTQTQYTPIITDVPAARRHARDFGSS
ncbi:uncharacterized protein TRAVEDRAFT_26513 [Trametes versicolor FP-101664 SS1]|uniref:uncharacterized protein n=1 Tax=Trametes versicolor (strain FP-101664) TaxID=717944 RepID=UPI0004623313|nr:uncharacterized protein TRAVEDRAFT_26513 [Trametes versicolor FP-101664 SS1]EIW63055.1 hypothetical protein TRAVEDRAFT_26513 [Trametes versicolor FP-101664 SS1]